MSSWRPPTCRSRRSSRRSSCSNGEGSRWASTGDIDRPVRCSASPRRCGCGESRCGRCGCPARDVSATLRCRRPPQRDATAGPQASRCPSLTQPGIVYCGSSSSRSSPSRSWPPSTAATFLRRSGIVRATVAIGLGAIIALGAIAVRPARPHDRHPDLRHRPADRRRPSGRRSRTGVELDVRRDHRVLHADGSRVGRGRAGGRRRRRAVDLHLDDRRHRRDGRAGRALGRRHLPHDHRRRPGALAGTGRPLTTPARAGFLTRGPRPRSSPPPSRSASGSASTTAFTIAFDRPVDPGQRGRRSGSTRRAGHGHGRGGGRRRVPRFMFTPERAAARRTRATSSSSTASRDDDGVAVEPTHPRGQDRRRPEVVRFRPTDTTRRTSRATTTSRSASASRWIAPRRRRPSRSRRRQGDQGHGHASPRTTRSSCSIRPSPSPTTRESSPRSPRSRTSADGVPLQRAGRGSLPDRAEAGAEAGRQQHRPRVGGSCGGSSAAARSAAAAGRRSSATTWA